MKRVIAMTLALILLLCGCGGKAETPTLPETTAAPTTEPTADPATAPQAAQTHLWITHGEQDTCVLPDSARRMADALRQLGADLHHTEFPGVAHDAWTPTLTDPDFHRWLNAHLFPNPENPP